MLSFVTVVSLKALIYVASLGIFAGNLWLFKDNVYTFTHLLAASKNSQSMSPFNGPAPLPNDAGPILSPAIGATRDEKPDFDGDDEDDENEDEEGNDDGYSAYMDQIHAAYR